MTKKIYAIIVVVVVLLVVGDAVAFADMKTYSQAVEYESEILDDMNYSIVWIEKRKFGEYEVHYNYEEKGKYYLYNGGKIFSWTEVMNPFAK